MSENLFLSLEEVATLFGFNASAVYRLARRGVLPGFKMGGRWRFNRGMLEEWVADRVSVERMKAKELASHRDGKRKLEELSALKDTFVATVSHELRTPLSIAHEGVNLLLEEIPGTVNEQQKRILLATHNSMSRLTRLIFDLLDVSNLERGTLVLHKSWMNLKDLIKEVELLFVPKAQEKGLLFKISFPRKGLELYADRDRILQALSNVVENALKFTQRGAIELSTREKEGVVECAITDTGPGIAREDLPKVFGKFEQFNRTPGSGSKGTGLGLAIAERLIELHGGAIQVKSALGQGTTFILTLPKGVSKKESANGSEVRG